MIESVCNSVPGWFPPPHGYQGVREAFGDISVSGTVLIGPRWWESQNMSMTEGLPGYDKPVYMNRYVVPMLIEALRECVALGDGYQIKSIGSFSPRPKRSQGSQLSMHSWGIAVDINAEDNPPLRITSAADLAKRQKTIPDAWVRVFKSVGWVWGGDFASYWDPMHFQWASGC